MNKGKIREYQNNFEKASNNENDVEFWLRINRTKNPRN